MYSSTTMSTLESERSAVPFDIETLGVWWVGSQEKLLSQRRISQAIRDDPDFKALPDDDIYRLSKLDRYVRTSERFALARKKYVNGDILQPPYEVKTSFDRTYFMERAIGSDAATMGIHYAMFLPTLRNQASAEQKKLWLPAAEALAISGCYGQTEMAHGSDVKSLATEAKYDPATKTFDLHTPNLGATKWWPASLGRTATHAIIHARLLLPKPDMKWNASAFTDHGVKPFLVQLRDLETHKNLPGIESGDIGATMGIVAMEEGWCRFNHVKLPRICLLARYGEVDEAGNWIPPPPRFGKRAYATMLQVRSGMVVNSSNHLGKASTIAIRYCAMRRQFRKIDSDNEVQVLDYPQVARRALPWVATAYALKATGRVMSRMHREMESRVDSQGDDVAANMESEVHAVGSCLKTVCTTFAVDGIEELRRVCGGYGYSMFSGLQEIYGSAMVNFTGEGENYMLIQQASRHLLKFYRIVAAGGKVTSPNFSFIKSARQLEGEKPIGDGFDFLNVPLQTLVNIFEHRAGVLLVETAHAAGPEGSAVSLQDSAQWEGIQAAWAYGEYLILRSFVESVEQSKNMEKETQICEILTTLCRLFAINLLNQRIADFYMDGYFTPANGVELRASLKVLLKQVRPLAIGLVDAMNFQDEELNSAIGRKDGQVYETLLSWAEKDPMNEGAVIKGYHDHYGKVLQAGRQKFHQMTGVQIQDVPGIVQRPPLSKM